MDEQQKTKLEMQRQKKLLNMALKSAKMDIWDLDVINKRMFYSPDGQNKLGTLNSLKDVPESLIDEQFIHPDSADDARKFYEQVYFGEKATKELKIRQNNGTYEWERLSYVPVYDENGKHIESVGNEVNITDEKLQKQLEESLRAAKEANQAKNITFADHVKKEEFYVLEGDADRIQQILMNIIGNAIKFTPIQLLREQKEKAKQLEVDFVCNQGSKRIYIQSALALPTIEKEEQEQQSLSKINDSFKKIIIVKDGPTHYNESGILILNLFEFLMEQDSINK